MVKLFGARLRFWPTALSAAAFLLTAGLGTWQVYRLAWKTDVIAKMEARLDAPVRDLPATEGNAEDLEWYSLRARGTWLPRVYHLVAREVETGSFGYHLLAPLQRTSGDIVLVNLGWIPAEVKTAYETAPWATAEPVSVVGTGRLTTGQRLFVPDNRPDENQYFFVDGEALKQELEADILPLMLVAQVNYAGLDAVVPGQTVTAIRNFHLSYVITWYGIALGILAVFLVWQWQAAKREQD